MINEDEYTVLKPEYDKKISLAALFSMIKSAVIEFTNERVSISDEDKIDTIDKTLCELFIVLLRCLGSYTPSIEHVITHKRVDLDAVACCSLGLKYTLIPGNAAELEPTLGYYKILDHPLGFKGKASAYGEALFWSRQTREAHKNTPLDWLAQEIDAADTGKPIEGFWTLAELLEANYKLEAWYEQALVYKQIAKEKFKEWEAKIVFHKCKDYIFVEIPAEVQGAIKGPDFAIYLQEKHPDLVGAVYQDGFNLGIFRYPGKEHPKFEEAHKGLREWYLDHRSGWMLSWGTRKVPKKMLPLIGQPKTCADLVKFVEETL